MDRCAFGVGVDLIEDITELQINFIFCHVTNVRRCEDIWVGRKNVVSVRHRFRVEDVNSRMYAAPCDFVF